MDQPTRQDSYRQLRILIDPAPRSEQCVVAVVARTSHRGAHRDHLVLRVVVRGDLASDDPAVILLAAAHALRSAVSKMQQHSA
jgi:hypothetical protein